MPCSPVLVSSTIATLVTCICFLRARLVRFKCHAFHPLFAYGQLCRIDRKSKAALLDV